MYQLKFKKLPKEVKAQKVIPYKKWISLPEGQELYLEICTKGAFDGEIELLVKHNDTKQELLFTFSYEPGLTLSDIISQDIINEIRKASDEKFRQELEIIENELMLSFAEPITRSIQKPKKATTFLNKVKELLPEKRVTEEKAAIAQPKEDTEEPAAEQYNQTVDYQPEYDEQAAASDGDYYESQESIEPQSSVAPVPVEPNKQVELQEQPEEKLTLEKYVMIKDNEQITLLEQTIQELEKCIEQGSTYVLEQLKLNNPQSYMDQQKKNYIEAYYSPTFFEKLLGETKESLTSLINSCIFELTENYENQINRNILKEHQAQLDSLKANIESKYQEQLEREFKELSGVHENDRQRIKARHEQEKQELENKHSAELLQMNNEIASRKRAKEDAIRELEAAEIQTVLEECKKELLQKHKFSSKNELEVFKVRKMEDLRKTVTESINLVREKESNYLNLLKERLKSEQSDFEKRYELHLKEQEAQRNEEKRKRELLIQEREVDLKEKKLFLEEKSLSETKETTARLEKQNYDLLLQQQNQFMESLKQMHLMTQATSSSNIPEKPDIEKKSLLWKIFLGTAASVALIGAVGSGIYAIQTVRAVQNETVQTMNSQTSALEERVLNILETQTAVEEEKPTASFEEYLVAGEYLEAAEQFPEKEREIIEYLIAQGDQEKLSEFLAKYPTDNKILLLKIAILEGKDEEMICLYKEVSTVADQELTEAQKERLALAFYQAQLPEEATQILGG